MPQEAQKYKYIIIGGGFFGCYLACMLKEREPGSSVAIFEAEDALLKRASYNNQARIHGGYHYPRSLVTALRSRANFRRFLEEFKDCVYDGFEQYYAIGRSQSKVTASQFRVFCKRISAPLETASPAVKKLFNKNLVEEVFRVEEVAFDAVKLRDIMLEKLRALNIPVFLKTRALRVYSSSRPALTVDVFDKNSGVTAQIGGDYCFVCAYSNINTLLADSEIDPLALKHEMTELALVEVPEELRDKGITMMCGPFFSFMPFPPRGLHTLSHVRYTPHHFWQDDSVGVNNREYFEKAKNELRSKFMAMKKDTARYVPAAEDFKYVDSLIEIKTVLPRNEHDDGRPILFKKDVGGIKNLICILGGKIDNVYDLDNELKGVI